jgi:hypothetical protein
MYQTSIHSKLAEAISAPVAQPDQERLGLQDEQLTDDQLAALRDRLPGVEVEMPAEAATPELLTLSFAPAHRARTATSRMNRR